MKAFLVLPTQKDFLSCKEIIYVRTYVLALMILGALSCSGMDILYETNLEANGLRA